MRKIHQATEITALWAALRLLQSVKSGKAFNSTELSLVRLPFPIHHLCARPQLLRLMRGSILRVPQPAFRVFCLRATGAVPADNLTRFLLTGVLTRSSSASAMIRLLMLWAVLAEFRQMSIPTSLLLTTVRRSAFTSMAC